MRHVAAIEELLAFGLSCVMAGAFVLCAIRLLLPMRRLEPACRKCHYPLKGLPDSQSACPECGSELTAQNHAPSASWTPARPAMLATVGVVLGLAAVGISDLELATRKQSITYGLNQPMSPAGGLILNASTRAQWKDTILRSPWKYRWNLVIWRRLESEPVFEGVGVGNATMSLPINWLQDAETFHSDPVLIVSSWGKGRANIQPMVNAAVNSLGNSALKTWEVETARIAKDIESIYLGYPRLRDGPGHVLRTAEADRPAQWEGSRIPVWCAAMVFGLLVIWGVRHIEKRVQRKREAAMAAASRA